MISLSMSIRWSSLIPHVSVILISWVSHHDVTNDYYMVVVMEVTKIIHYENRY